jgi:RNA polymerase sigma factor (sigma-70 family)
MATLYRELGDLGAAEDAAQEAATIALTRWLDDGIPDRPGAWITTVARRKAVDRIRRERTGRTKTELLARLEEPLTDADPSASDDQLGLFFGCCHPALNVEAQIALTLRSLGGLSTAEIARSFLVAEPTMAQRLVRAKRKIASAAIPFRIPDESEMLQRLGVVHQVLYLVFNEGAYPTSGVDHTRVDLADEAIRLGGLLAELMVDDAESLALHALFLLIHARRSGRLPDGGEPILLPDQDRSRWDSRLIEEGQSQLDRAIRLERPGPVRSRSRRRSRRCTTEPSPRPTPTGSRSPCSTDVCSIFGRHPSSGSTTRLPSANTTDPPPPSRCWKTPHSRVPSPPTPISTPRERRCSGSWAAPRMPPIAVSSSDGSMRFPATRAERQRCADERPLRPPAPPDPASDAGT